MSQPRYAPSGIISTVKGFSLRGTLFATSLMALILLLGGSALQASGRTTAVAAPAQPPVQAAATPDQPEIDSLIKATGIQPSVVPTAQPTKPGKVALKIKPVANDGLIGPAGDTGQLGIPTMVLKAYKQAAATVDAEETSCHLPWWLLAGIGHTESGHAESGRLYADGTTRGRILGPRLNGGIAGDAIISDTDHGKYDGDTVYDRAVGPMQFIPSTWERWGADGNGDGKRDPNNIFDATLAAGHYLCADARNLATKAGLEAAVLSYNHSQAYLDTVLAWGYAYRSGASSLPDQSIPVVGDVTIVRPPLGSKPGHKPVKLKPKPTKSAKPTPSASADPTHSASSTHSASPTHSASTSPTVSSTGSTSASPTCTPTPSTSATTTAPSSKSSASVASSADSQSAAQSAATSAAAAAATMAAKSSADGNSTSVASTSPTSSPTSTCTR